MREISESQLRVMKSDQDKYDRQMKAWAIDRAIEAFNAGLEKGDVISIADKLCAWIYSTPIVPSVPTEEQAVQILEETKDA